MDGRLFLAGSCKAGQGWVDNGCGDVPFMCICLLCGGYVVDSMRMGVD